ncbi:MAG: glycosidase, partial [Melioribacteraceae bacterium]
MTKNPSIYEINTRVWIKRFDTPTTKAKLRDVPLSYWQEIADLGIEYVWLMGIWQTCESTIDKYCFEEGLTKSYSRALKDWKHEDISSSPYSIDDYQINPLLGDEDDFLWLKNELNG